MLPCDCPVSARADICASTVSNYAVLLSIILYAVPYSTQYSIVGYFKLFYTILNYFKTNQHLFCKNNTSDEKHYLPKFRVLKNIYSVKIQIRMTKHYLHNFRVFFEKNIYSAKIILRMK